LKANSGSTSSGATTYFMVALTNSLDKQVNASKNLFGDPTRSHGEYAFNLGVVNQGQTYSMCKSYHKTISHLLPVLILGFYGEKKTSSFFPPPRTKHCTRKFLLFSQQLNDSDDDRGNLPFIQCGKIGEPDSKRAK
jgi:hypothetical protein